MDDVDLLIVGPASGRGGIAQYIGEQRRRLADRVAVRTFDNATPAADSPAGFVLGALATVAGWLRFPFRRRPEVVHLHTSHYYSFYLSAAYVLFAALVWRVPVVVHVHGSSFDEFVADASPPVAALQRLVFGSSDAVVVLSEYWRERLAVRVPERKLVVRPNAVAPERYDPDRSSDRPHLAFVSEHTERKGIVETADAIGRLKADGVDFRATIAGSGPLSDRAEAVAAEHEGVEYVGYLPEDGKRELLGAATVYVLPTYAEGLPIAVLEAMAGGNAVVSTDVGSIPSVVDGENGALVPPGDVDALTAALERLLTDPEAVGAMGRVSRERVEEGYAWDALADDLVALYGRLLAGESPHATAAVPADD